jgi:hypothetical protein
MGKLVRKSVMVDPEQLQRLASRLGMNESEAIRFAIDGLLHEQEIMAAAAAIRRRGGLDDVFGRAQVEAGVEAHAR